MLFENMNISRLMINVQLVDGDKIRKKDKEKKKYLLGTMSILSRNNVVEIARRVNKVFSPGLFISKCFILQEHV